VTYSILKLALILVNVGSPRNAVSVGEVHGFFVFLSIALVIWHVTLNINYLKMFLKKQKT
jgi:hypothetical protein